MSCGNRHETACAEVLDVLTRYVDGELGDEGCAQVSAHLYDEDCQPCLEEMGLDRLVKQLVARCGRAPAPQHLREQVRVRLRQVSVTSSAGTTTVTSTSVSTRRA